MSIEVIPAKEALKRLRENPVSRWPERGQSERLVPIAKPRTSSKFQLKDDDKIFCVGSCFARELEGSLSHLGFDVSSQIGGLPRSARRAASDASLFNKYNLPSTLNEIRWALDPEFHYSHEKVLIEDQDGYFLDFQLSASAYPDTWEESCRLREAFNRHFAAIGDADVVLITLALSEAWFDKSTGLYLNKAPRKPLVVKYPDRFELRVLDYQQSLSDLEDIYRVLSTFSKKKQRILLILSPVPLAATFRDSDVMLANSYSKSLLRTVAEEFIRDKDDVAYLPGYEFVALSSSAAVWDKRDLRHVDKYFVRYMMSSILETFMSRSHSEVTQLAKATALHRAGLSKEAADALRSVRSGPESLMTAGLFIQWKLLTEKLRSMKTTVSTLRSTLGVTGNESKGSVPLTKEDRRNHLRVFARGVFRGVLPSSLRAREEKRARAKARTRK